MGFTMNGKRAIQIRSIRQGFRTQFQLRYRKVALMRQLSGILVFVSLQNCSDAAVPLWNDYILDPWYSLFMGWKLGLRKEHKQDCLINQVMHYNFVVQVMIDHYFHWLNESITSNVSAVIEFFGFIWTLEDGAWIRNPHVTKKYKTNQRGSSWLIPPHLLPLQKKKKYKTKVTLKKKKKKKKPHNNLAYIC